MAQVCYEEDRLWLLGYLRIRCGISLKIPNNASMHEILRRNLYYKSSSCSKISVYPTPSHFAVFPYRCYHFLAAGAGRPEHVVYEASKMLLTPLTLMKETTLTMEGTSFPSFPSSAGTESFNSSLLPCFIRYAGEAVENQSIQRS
ncbi:hypothetical protein SESBI_24850 [Sesbania bispinosa]|nr:hypothetical protein SESBI_24850 [Sesbania bispinosa]